MKTKWTKFKCGGGARWTSVMHDYTDEICSFSGCNCGTKVKNMGTTTNVNEASAWFRIPSKNTKP